MTLQEVVKIAVENKVRKAGVAYLLTENGSQACVKITSKDYMICASIYMFATDMHIELTRESREIMHVSGEYADITVEELKAKINACINIVQSYDMLAEAEAKTQE